MAVLVLSSPVYFYSICAQLKAVIDRTVARWTEIANKELYYIMTATEEEDDTMDGTLACFHGFAMCIDGYEEKGVLYGKGVYVLGEIIHNESVIKQIESLDPIKTKDWVIFYSYCFKKR